MAKKCWVAIVGAMSLRGKELKEVLEASRLLVEKLTLLDDDEALGQLTDYDGEPTFVQAIDPDAFRPGQVVFFASTNPPFTRRHWSQAAAADAIVIDLSHALVEEPHVAVRAAFLPAETPEKTRWMVSPHPAVLVLLALLKPLAERFGLVRAVANIFEPVSERGASGLDELQGQTTGLLSFQEMPKRVFDAQVAFNLLAGYGNHSPTQLEEVESVVTCELGRCAPELAQKTALRVLQAPVFHGLAVSLWADFRQALDAAVVETALAGPWVQVVDKEEVAPGVTDAAGRDSILLGSVVSDRSSPSALWLWAVADNLRLAARNAVELAEQLAR